MNISINIRRNKGYTFTEVFATIVILGFLAMMAIPKFMGVVQQTRFTDGVETLMAIYNNQVEYSLENGGIFTTDWNDLGIDQLLATSYYAAPVLQSGATVGYIQQIDGDFRLQITAIGEVQCVNDGSTGLCSQFHY